MSTSESHNLRKAGDLAEEAHSRLQTILLEPATDLTTTEVKKVKAYANHLKALGQNIDEINEALEERVREATVPSA